MIEKLAVDKIKNLHQRGVCLHELVNFQHELLYFGFHCIRFPWYQYVAVFNPTYPFCHCVFDRHETSLALGPPNIVGIYSFDALNS